MIRSSPPQDVQRLLDTRDAPLLSTELAQQLALSERVVAYMLMDAVRCGRVAKQSDGRFHTAMGRNGAALTEILQMVAECEEHWRFLDRFGL